MHIFQIDSADVRLSVRRQGQHDAPTVVLLHGYPDTGAVWQNVAARLSTRFDVIVADMRGAGLSTAPADRSGYRMRRLVDDIAHVIDAARPEGGAVHLVGHDWGSVQGWGAVLREHNDARLTGRIASFTSISGPPLPLFTQFFRKELRAGRLDRAGRQLAHSWYIGAFQVPWLPELAMRTFAGRIRASLERSQRGATAAWASTFTQDAANGLNLYRANIGARLPQRTNVPVQLIVPVHDAFLLPMLFDRIEDFAGNIVRTDVSAGHWVQLSHPELTAELVTSHVEAHMA